MSLTTSNKLFTNFMIKLLLVIVIIGCGIVLFITDKDGNSYIQEKEQRITDLIELDNALQKTNYAYQHYLNIDSVAQLDSLKFRIKDLGAKMKLLATFKNDTELYKTEIAAVETALREEEAFYSQQYNLFTQKLSVVSLDNALTSKVGATHYILAKLIATERGDLNGRVIQDYRFFGGLAFVVLGTASIILLITIGLYWRTSKALNEQETYDREISTAKQATQSVYNAKSEYLAMISHEIRTPMNGVLGMSNLLLQGSLTSEQQDYARTIHDSAESLLRIVNDVLDFSKIEAGTIYLNQASLNIRELIEQVFAQLPETNSNMKVSYEINKNVPNFINCDAVRLRQVLHNFLGNALKFTEEGTVTLDCKVIDKDENGRMRLGFVIKDTGIGIADEKVKLLFKPFVQVADTDRRKYGGSGLGLSIAYKLITMMNGKVKVKSELGKGSTFTFYIVTQENEEAVKVETPVKAVVQNTLDNELSKVYPLKILVVDDNEINLMLIMRTLSKLGYESKKCTNGQIAVDMAKEEHFDLIFMDMQMPIMDGTIATTEIRKHYRVYEYPVVVALTANALGDGKDKCLEAGMQDFIAKPFKPAEIEEIIKKWAPKVIAYKEKNPSEFLD